MDEATGQLIKIISLIFFLVFSVSFIIYEYMENRRTLRKLGADKEGKVVGGTITHHRVVLNRNGQEISVFQNIVGPQQFCITAQARWQTPHLQKLTIRRSPLVPLARMLGVRGIKTGNDEFDRAYLVRASDASFSRSFLTPEIQNLLLPLRKRAYSFWAPFLTIDPGEFVLTLPHDPFDNSTEKLENLAELASALLYSLSKLGIQ